MAKVVAGGDHARAALAAGSGRVTAVFERSLYLESAVGLCCVGSEGLGGGPLNLLCRGMLPIPGRARPGTAWQVRGDVLTIEPGWRFVLAPYARWVPPPAPRFTEDVLAQRLAACGDLLARRREIGPVLPVVLAREPATADPFTRAFDVALPRFEGWLARALAGDPRPPEPATLDPLIGLGPGLTPSGDDLLAGALIMLRQLGEPGVGDVLAHTVLERAPARTAAISAAHLAAACEGQGMSALHEAIGALVADEDVALAAALDTLAGVGHSSGLDAWAGVMLVARRWLGA